MDKKTKIIYVTHHPYWRRNHYRLGIEYLIKQGYEVTVYRIINSETIRFDEGEELYTGSTYKEIDIQEFKRTLKNSSDIYYLTNLTEEAPRCVVSSGARYYLITGMGPIIPPPFGGAETKKSWHVLHYFFQNKHGKNLIRRVKDVVRRDNSRRKELCFKKKLINNQPLFAVTATEYSKSIYIPNEILKGRIIKIHSLDYDDYLDNREGDSCKQHILFCDSGFYDGDYDSLFLKNSYTTVDNRKECFEQLNALFNKLEEYYGVPVIVCGHPHTRYSADSFLGRRIVFNDISLLTKNAVAFILNSSTAVSFAALFNIPTLFVANRFFKEFSVPAWHGANTYDYIKHSATVLGCCFLDMDDMAGMEHPWDMIKTMDCEKRKEYIREFIIDSELKDRKTYEYMVDYLNELI